MTECKLVLPSERMEIIINSFNEQIDKLVSTVKKKDATIKEKDSALKEKDARIEELERLLAERK